MDCAPSCTTRFSASLPPRTPPASQPRPSALPARGPPLEHLQAPGISDLLRGRIARFSLDALVYIATALGRKVTVKLTDAA
ncbi:MAG: XRE family transcriptional regulator [Acidobacteriota bacterium]|nr:XRE family transcriptional regulator [Acidobacteriota bacterium]MDE3161684.1 XRE family transcriptional regulator [Acidobacteriota bacterium]